MFCSGCLKRLPSFIASGPSVLETMKRRDVDPRARAHNAALSPASAALGFPLWLPAVLIAMCAAFFGWVASMTASGSGRLPAASSSSPESVPSAVPTSPLAAVDSVSGASRFQGKADTSTVLAPAARADEGNARAAEADALDVVAGFYRALAAGDGRAAANAVTPAKRDLPAFREERMSRFYGSLREPLAVESLRPVADNRIEAKYRYRATRTPCRATATVETEVVGERTFIRGIRATC
jgi:hypothetical protein